tara:strand:- start:118 stop:543 length:426 start_codon:yes stop_codon:yes gene_type:complete
MKHLSVLLLFFFLLSGCYQSSLTPMMIVGPAAGAAQGKIVSSALSTGINYAVKEKTGKFPYEHIIKREKDKVLKKAAKLEKTVTFSSKELKSKLGKSTEMIMSKKDENTKKLYVSLKKVKKITKETFVANNQRYSYWPKQK